MKTPCDIIRDLLPLYAEDMTSKASNEMVEEHLGECESCTNYLEELRKPNDLSEKMPLQSLKHIKKTISMRRLFSVLTAVFFLLSLFACVQTFLDTTVFLSAEQAVQSVEEMEDGSLRIYFTNLVTGWSQGHNPEKDPGNWGVLALSKVSKLISARKGSMIEGTPVIGVDGNGYAEVQMGAEANVWYVDYSSGKGSEQLWDGGADTPPEGFVFMEGVNSSLAWYSVTMAVFSALFAFAAWMHRNKRGGKGMAYAALLFGCACIAALFASGGQFADILDESAVKLQQSFILLIPMFATGFCAMKLYGLKKLNTP